jgi:hypothetical protein
MTLLHIAEGTEPKEEVKPKPRGGELPTGPSLERYARATVKQIVLIYDGAQYLQMIERLQRVITVERVKTPKEALPLLLDLWEREHDVAD